MRKFKKNTNKEASQSTKGIRVILMFIFFSVFFLSIVSAVEFDDVKNYDETTKTYSLENFFGLGKHISDLELKTPQVFTVPRGYQKVAEIEIRNGEFDYNEIINGIELYNIKDDMKEIVRNVDYKYKKIIQVPNYKTTCEESFSLNGSIITNCTREQIGLKDESVWEDFTNNSLLKGENLTLGIFAEVKKGDRIEWVLNVYGNEKLTKWAVWTESLNVDILAYNSFNESSGTNAPDLVNGTYNWTTFNSPTWDIGLIGNALHFDGASQYAVQTNPIFLEPNKTINFWLNLDAIDGADQQRLFGRYDAGGAGEVQMTIIQGTKDIRIRWTASNSTGFDLADQDVGSGVWTMVTLVISNTHIKGYINGTAFETQGIFSPFTSAVNTSLGARDRVGTDDDWFDGLIDEFGIWNRTLSDAEVTQLFNGGAGISFQRTFAPAITLNSPVDNFNTSSNSITFNGTITSSGVLNVTLFIDGVLNETNSSGIDNTDYLFTKILSEGKHNWTYEACSALGCTNATTRTFTIDTEAPHLNITSPNETFNFHEINTNLSLNWNATDNLALDVCWFDWNGTNQTVTCADNTTQILIDDGENKNLTFYVNDTLGNLNNSFVTWDYRIFQNSLTFNPNTTGGNTESFTLNITKLSSIQISIVDLIYNGSASSASFTVGDNPIITANKIIPNPSTDSNLSFFFSFFMSDSSVINTTSNNQTVFSFAVGNCTAQTTLIYNFTLLDEDNQTKLENVTIDYAINIFDSTRTISIADTSFNSTDNPTAICINQNLTDASLYSLDGILKYVSSDGDFLTRYYNILNFSLTNATVPNLINIYDVLATTGTPFQLTFRDSSLALSPNILVNVNKQFVSSNDFKTVEIPITDSNGQTIVNLERNIGIYNLIFTNSSGIILATFNKITAFCQDFTIGECTINLEIPAPTVNTFNLSESTGISFSLDYQNSTSTATFTFSSLNSTPILARIVGTTQNQFGNSSVCDNSLTSTLGTLTCNASAILETDDFLFIDIFSNGEFIETRVININPENALVGGQYGSNGYFIAFLMLLFVMMLFSNDRQTFLIMLGMSWVVILALGLVKGAIIGAVSGGIWLIVSIFMMIWRLKKEEIGG